MASPRIRASKLHQARHVSTLYLSNPRVIIVNLTLTMIPFIGIHPKECQVRGGLGIEGDDMTIFNVSTNTQLASALTKAVGGDTIALAAGKYSMTINGRRPSSSVTITSQSLTNPAQLTWLKVDNSSNFRFKSIDIGRALTSTETISSATMAKISLSANITFDTVRVRGSLDGNPANDGVGLAISNSTGVKVINSDFQQLFRGLVLSGVEDAQVLNNKFHDIRSDGIDGVSVRRVRIDGNTFTNFYKISGDHADAIQFWTTGTTRATTDVVIANNVVMQGKGGSIQGIFMRDELGTLPFQRITIENNLIYEAGMPNGIAVMGGKDIVIRRNTAVSPNDDATRILIRTESVAGATIEKNVADQYMLGGTNLTKIDNLTLANNPVASTLTSLNLDAAATISGLILSGYGYQIPSTTTSSMTSTSTTTQTSASVEKIAVASTVEDTALVTTSAPTYPSFTVDGLYTGTFSSSGWRTQSVEPQPVTAVQTSTYYGGNAFRSSYQLFHA